MSRTRLMYPLSAALAAVLVLSACKKHEAEHKTTTPAATAPATAPATTTPATTSGSTSTTAPASAAVTVTAVELGNSVGANNYIAAPATTFAPRDTIYASVATRTSNAGATVPGKLSAKWIFQDGQTVHEDSRDLNLTGDGVTVFQISKPDGFPPGRYKLEISLNGSVVQVKEFEVK